MKENETPVVSDQAAKCALWKRKSFWLILGAGNLLVIIAVACVLLIFNSRTAPTSVNASSLLSTGRESQTSQPESSAPEPVSNES